VTTDDAIVGLQESVCRIKSIMAEHPDRAAHAALETALRAAALAVAAPRMRESSRNSLMRGALVLLNMAVEELGLEAIYTCRVKTSRSFSDGDRAQSG
jgi:hypothetical protein